MKVCSIYQSEDSQNNLLSLFSHSVSAGFPSPADDGIERKLDLNKSLIKHPAATFFVRVEGESMKDAGIYNQDLLIVDRSITPKENHVVLAVINGEFTVKKIKKSKSKLFLLPENEKFKPIEITEEMDFSIWGIVTYAIHSL
ncbi:MAG: Protein UmuD [Chlamydiae bacterium]|nr:Protein UmuD [Chlamydiota bacterium]